MCYTYCFSAATIVTLTRLNATSIRTLTVFLLMLKLLVIKDFKSKAYFDLDTNVCYITGGGFYCKLVAIQPVLTRFNKKARRKNLNQVVIFLILCKYF
jgi:hypothetical protein